jgi:Flp pilus assembly protein TadD
MDHRKLFPLLIIAAGLLAYHNSFSGEFIFDDLTEIVDNPRIRQLWPPWTALSGTSRPIVQLSLAVNYAVGGLNPWGYHAVNLAIHVVAGLILFGLLNRSLRWHDPVAGKADGASWLSLVAAVIWVVHPVQTESVTYIVQRAESLMGLFFLLTLYCVARAAESARADWWNAAAVASCALGMASKPVMVAAPVMVLLYDRVFMAKSVRRALRERRGLYAGLFLGWVLLGVLLARTRHEWESSAGLALPDVTATTYALSQPAVVLHYLRLSIGPAGQCLDYAWPAASDFGDAFPAIAAVGSLVAIVVWGFWRKPKVGFWGAWFFITLLPSSSVIPLADLAFEHRMYIPLAGLVVLGVTGGRAVFERVARRLRLQAAAQSAVQTVVAGGIVLALIALTAIRNESYRDAVGMWNDVIAKRPDNARARYELGNVWMRRGRFEEAAASYRQALQIAAGYAMAHANLATALAAQGSTEEAIGHYFQALQTRPELFEAQQNLGVLLVQRGDVGAAIHHLQAAVRLRPDLVEPHLSLADALARAGRFDEAIIAAVRGNEVAVSLGDRKAVEEIGIRLAQYRAGRLSSAREK